jgi:hypothetical protein
MRPGLMASARASHDVKNTRIIHLDRPLTVGLLQDVPSRSRHRNGITDECIGKKACELEESKVATLIEGPNTKKYITYLQQQRNVSWIGLLKVQEVGNPV